MKSKAKIMLDGFVYQWKRVVVLIPNGLLLQYSLMLGDKLWKGGGGVKGKRKKIAALRVLLIGEGEV